MSGRDWFLFISTFVVAVLCGMWLYFTTFVPEYVANPVVQEIAEQISPAWTMSVELYGGCARTGQCPAYELTSRGKYRYQPAAGAEIQTGTVPLVLKKQYTDVLTESALQRWSEPTKKSFCESFVDGFDYRIHIQTKETAYELDTCRTALPRNGELAELIDATLRYLDNPDSFQFNTETVDDRNVRSYVEQTLDATFDYDEQ